MPLTLRRLGGGATPAAVGAAADGRRVEEGDWRLLRAALHLFANVLSAISARHAAAHVDIIKLKGQNGIVPRDFSSLGHRVSLSGAAWHTASI